MFDVQQYKIHKDKAIKMRKGGLSYSEILEKIPVAKSTLSLWLREVGLSKRQKQRLTEKKLASIRRGWMKMHQLRVERMNKMIEDSINEVDSLISNPLWLTGTMLYWGEGGKEKEWRSERVVFSNMDLQMHKIFRRWAKQYLSVEDDRFRYEIYIHRNHDVEKIKRFWHENLSIPLQELRVYFKPTNPNPTRKNVGNNYNGVFRIRITKSSNLNRKIAGWTKGVIKYFD